MDRRRRGVMTINETPKIITSRFDVADGHTLAGYLRTGGYVGLRDALAKTPTQVHDDVKNASLLGRGGAGVPLRHEVGPGSGQRLAPLHGRQR
jgi:NADH:ubiquinone oxidoreductase subunit F (NADH-binding)